MRVDRADDRVEIKNQKRRRDQQNDLLFGRHALMSEVRFAVGRASRARLRRAPTGAMGAEILRSAQDDDWWYTMLRSARSECSKR